MVVFCTANGGSGEGKYSTNQSLRGLGDVITGKRLLCITRCQRSRFPGATTVGGIIARLGGNMELQLLTDVLDAAAAQGSGCAGKRL